MSVHRISDDGLNKILHNRVVEPITCVIKFYSNGCHMCHALQQYYIDISQEYETDPNIVFYAYNVDDDPSIEKLLKFQGVPTIAIVKPDPGGSYKKIASYKVLGEPESPNKKTWYRVKDIKKFIEEEKK